MGRMVGGVKCSEVAEWKEGVDEDEEEVAVV